MSVVFWVMILIVKGRIAGRSVHHAGLSVHHVAHRRIRTVCPAWSCGQWWKHYTLLRLDLCSVIGRRVLDKLAVTHSKVLEELETSMPTRYSVSSSQRGRMRVIERNTYRGARRAVWCDSPKSRSHISEFQKLNIVSSEYSQQILLTYIFLLHSEKRKRNKSVSSEFFEKEVLTI